MLRGPQLTLERGREALATGRSLAGWESRAGLRLCRKLGTGAGASQHLSFLGFWPGCLERACGLEVWLCSPCGAQALAQIAGAAPRGTAAKADAGVNAETVEESKREPQGGGWTGSNG